MRVERMAGFNRVVMMGNLTRDPELKQLPSGQLVCRLGLASNRQFKNRQTGESMSEVCFVDIDVWGAQAESCGQFLAKGRLVLIEGRLKLDSWQDADGKNRSKHTIVADRVVFIPTAGVQDDVSSDTYDQTTQSQEDVLRQVEEVARKQAAAKKDTSSVAKREHAQPASSRARAQDTSSSVASDAGEVDMADEPPFKDDLPF
jgi:single-strand DNA-binding protein